MFVILKLDQSSQDKLQKLPFVRVSPLVSCILSHVTEATVNLTFLMQESILTVFHIQYAVLVRLHHSHSKLAH